MRNTTADILNGANFLIRVAPDLDTARIALWRLMQVVSKFPDAGWVDALSGGQTMSKKWLIAKAKEKWGGSAFDHTVAVGGWVGTLAFFINVAGYPISKWDSVDLDSYANSAARELNPGVFFSAHDADMYDYEYSKDSLVINTACEHIPDLSLWIDKMPSGTKVILQSNNMFEIPDHTSCVHSVEEFLEQTTGSLSDVTMDTLPLPWNGWKRFMLMGYKT